MPPATPPPRPLLTVTVDNQAPTGTVAINGGAAATNSTSVTLTLSASDALSGVTQMRFSNTGTRSRPRSLRDDQGVDAVDRRRHQDRLRPVQGCGRQLVGRRHRYHRARHHGADHHRRAPRPNITANWRHRHLDHQRSGNLAGRLRPHDELRVDHDARSQPGDVPQRRADRSRAQHHLQLSAFAPSDAAGNATTSANSTFKTAAAPADPNPPQVFIDGPANGTQVSNIVNVTADATDDTGVAGVQFYVDGVADGAQDTTDPYALAWDTRTVSNGAHTLTALARDIDGNTTLVGADDGQRRQHQLLPERDPGDRLQSSDRHQVPSRRAHAGRGARRARSRCCRRPTHRPTRRLSCSSPTSARPACSRASTTSPSIRTSPPTTTTTSSTRRDAEPRSPVPLHRQCNADRHDRRQRVHPLPGSAERQRRAPRRRDQLRQRRQDLLHHRRALRRRARRRT